MGANLAQDLNRISPDRQAGAYTPIPSERRLSIRLPEYDQKVVQDTLKIEVASGHYTHSQVKRTFDVIVAVLVLCLMAPILLVTAILVKLTSRGQIFFIQERVGLGGNIFRMYKFRSMVTDAEQLKAKFETQNEMDGPAFKIKNDPRVTRFGKILRKTSLDEFPQLLNVLTGDMSLVGPRPPLMSEVAQYRKWQTQRLSIKPGITCTWQISGRNEIKFEDWMRMDIRYILQAGSSEDLRILLRTFFAVLSRRGAS